jgi:hypothetical protein
MKKYRLGTDDATRVVLVGRAVRREIQCANIDNGNNSINKSTSSSSVFSDAIRRLVAKLSLDNIMYESSSDSEDENIVNSDEIDGLVMDGTSDDKKRFLRPEALSNIDSGGIERRQRNITKKNTRKRKHDSSHVAAMTSGAASSNSESSSRVIPSKRSKTTSAAGKDTAGGCSGSIQQQPTKRDRADSLTMDMDAKMSASSVTPHSGRTNEAAAAGGGGGTTTGQIVGAPSSVASALRPRSKRLHRVSSPNSSGGVGTVVSNVQDEDTGRPSV